MQNVKLLVTLLLMLTGYAARSQDQTKLIAVVNRANWCPVCKANGERGGKTLMSYTGRGLQLFMNDLTDTATTSASKAVLENAGLYKAVYTSKRKGLGGLMQHCGLLKNKDKKSMLTGIVTFISPKTHRQLKQVSIAIADQEMKTDIETLLK